MVPSRLTLVCLVLLPLLSSAYGDTAPSDLEILRKKMEATREQMQASTNQHKCPAIFEYKTSPEYKAVCPNGNSCSGLKDAAFDKCISEFWSCHASYRKTLEADNLYNKFLNAACSEAAKNAKAKGEAAAARARQIEIDEKNGKRDSR